MSHKYYLLSCNICSKSFVDQQLLDQHYLVHNGVINTFDCLKCPRKFLHAHQFEKHKEFHLSNKMSEAVDTSMHIHSKDFKKLSGFKNQNSETVETSSCDADVKDNDENSRCNNIKETSSPNTVVKKCSPAEKARHLRIKAVAVKTESSLPCESMKKSPNRKRKPVENDSCNINQEISSPNTAVKKWSELSAAEKAKRLRKPSKMKQTATANSNSLLSCKSVQSNPNSRIKPVEFEMPEQSTVRNQAEMMKKKPDFLVSRSEAITDDESLVEDDEISKTSDEDYSPPKKKSSPAKKKRRRNNVKNVMSVSNANVIADERKQTKQFHKRRGRPKKQRSGPGGKAERSPSDIGTEDTHKSRALLKRVCDVAEGSSLVKSKIKPNKVKEFSDTEYLEGDNESDREVSESSTSDTDASYSDGVTDEENKKTQPAKKRGRPKKCRRESQVLVERSLSDIETEDSQKSRAVQKQTYDDAEGNAPKESKSKSPENVSDAECPDKEDPHKSRAVQKRTRNDAKGDALKKGGKRKLSKHVSDDECLHEDNQKSKAALKRTCNDVEGDALKKAKRKPSKKFSDAEHMKDEDDSDYEVSESSLSDTDSSYSDEAYIPEKESQGTKTKKKSPAKRKYVKHKFKTGSVSKPSTFARKQPWFALAEPVSNFENNSCSNNQEISAPNTVVKRWSELSPAERAKRLRKPCEIKPVAARTDTLLSSERIESNPSAKRKPDELEMPEDLLSERKKNKLSIEVQKKIVSLRDPKFNMQPIYTLVNPAHSGTGENNSQLPASSLQNDSQFPTSSLSTDSHLPASSMQKDSQLLTSSFPDDSQLSSSSMQNVSKTPSNLNQCPEKTDTRNILNHDIHLTSASNNPEPVSNFENDSYDNSQEISSPNTVVKMWSELSLAEKAQHLRKPVAFEMPEDLYLERKKNKLSIEVRKKLFPLTITPTKSIVQPRHQQKSPLSVSCNSTNLASDGLDNTSADSSKTTYNDCASKTVPVPKPNSTAAPNPTQSLKSVTEIHTIFPDSFPKPFFNKQKNKKFLYVGPNQNIDKVQSLIQDLDTKPSFDYDGILGQKVVDNFVFVKVTPEYMEKIKNETVKPKLCVETQQKEPTSLKQLPRNSQSSAVESFTAPNTNCSLDSQLESNSLQNEISDAAKITDDPGSPSTISCPGSPTSTASEPESFSMGETEHASFSLSAEETVRNRLDKILEDSLPAPKSLASSSLVEKQKRNEPSFAAKEKNDLVTEKATCVQDHVELISNNEVTEELLKGLEKRKLHADAQLRVKETTCRLMSSVKYDFENILGHEQHEIANQNSFESTSLPVGPKSLISESLNLVESSKSHQNSMYTNSPNTEIIPACSDISVSSSIAMDKTQQPLLHNSSYQIRTSLHPDCSSAEAMPQTVTDSTVGPNHLVQNIDELDIKSVIYSIISKISPACSNEKLLKSDCSQQTRNNSFRVEMKNNHENTKQNSGQFVHSNVNLIKSQEYQSTPLNPKTVNLNNLIALSIGSGALFFKPQNGTLNSLNQFQPSLVQNQTHVCTSAYTNQDFPNGISSVIKPQEKHQINTSSKKPQHYAYLKHAARKSVISSNKNSLPGFKVVLEQLTSSNLTDHLKKDNRENKNDNSASSSNHSLSKTNAVSIISERYASELPSRNISLSLKDDKTVSIIPKRNGPVLRSRTVSRSSNRASEKLTSPIEYTPILADNSASSSNHSLSKTNAVSIVSERCASELLSRNISLTLNDYKKQTITLPSDNPDDKEPGLPYIIDVRSVQEPELELSAKVLRRYQAKLEEKERKKREKYELKKKLKCLEKLLGEQSSMVKQESNLTSSAPKQSSISTSGCLDPSEVSTLEPNQSCRLLNAALNKVKTICSSLLNKLNDADRLIQLHDLNDLISKNKLWKNCHFVFKALRVCRLEAESICVKEVALSLHKNITKALRGA